MKQLSMHACIGEGNGNPLQNSCMENPGDRGAWWAAVYGVAQSRSQLKRLSSSSSSKMLYQAHLQWLPHLALILHYAFNRRYSRDCISEITWRGCRTTGCRAHPHSFWLVGLERSWKFTFPNKFPGDANTANHESHFEAQDSTSMPSASYCLPIFRARAT